MGSVGKFTRVLTLPLEINLYVARYTLVQHSLGVRETHQHRCLRQVAWVS